MSPCQVFFEHTMTGISITGILVAPSIAVGQGHGSAAIRENFVGDRPLGQMTSHDNFFCEKKKCCTESSMDCLKGTSPKASPHVFFCHATQCENILLKHDGIKVEDNAWCPSEGRPSKLDVSEAKGVPQ